MQSILSTVSRRRQNASCDQCRRSKRRCIVDSCQDGKTDTMCQNCRRLRYTCTFNFAESRKKQRIHTQADAGRSPTRERLELSDKAADGLPEFSADDFRIGFEENEDILNSWLNFDAEDRLDNNITPSQNSTAGLEPAALSHLPTVVPTETPHNVKAPFPSALSEKRQSLVKHRARSFVGCSPNSPIYLLNSSMNAAILDEHLNRICETIIGGCTSVFLDYDCNMYPGRWRYCIDTTDSLRPDTSSPTESHIIRNDTIIGPSTLTLAPVISSSSSEQPSQFVATGGAHLTLTSQDDGYKMTVLGAFQFLDHFSDLYGNRLNATARKRSEEVLKEVMRVSSLQWLPGPGSISETGSTSSNHQGRRSRHNLSPNIYADSWSRARLLLHEVHSIRSFKVILAIIAFDMITIPLEVCGDTPEITLRHEFLDVSLEKLSFLDGLVSKYCANLGPSSKYGALIESSLNLVCWFGYLRDTVAGLTTNRGCRLPEAPSNIQAPSNNEPSLSFVSSQDSTAYMDDNIANIGRRAMGEAFRIWRQVIRIKDESLWRSEGVVESSEKAFEAIGSTLTSIANFEQSFRPFMNRCADNFIILSDVSRKFFVFLVVFWDLGVLVLCEILNSRRNQIDSFHADLIINMRTCQWRAASSVAQMVECVRGPNPKAEGEGDIRQELLPVGRLQHVLALPAGEAFGEDSGLGAEVPLMVSHVSPGIVVMALEKALEQLIDWKLSSDYGLISDHTWEHHIGSPMKGLTSMEVTIGGSRTAGVALQSLMHDYGDILSECWPGDL